jgi:hypothetical protein
MSLLQVNVDEKLKKAINKKAGQYGVPASTLVRIVLVKSFLAGEKYENSDFGNVFNADRDNKGKGLKVDEFLAKL